MPTRAEYRFTVVGQWRLASLAEVWNPSAQQMVLQKVEGQPWSRHPQTLPLRLTLGSQERELYLKIFHPGRGAAAWKDALRRSKAFRAWRLGLDLQSAGFAVPMTIAAGEQRQSRFLRRAFLLTEKVDGQPAHLFLLDRFRHHGSRASLAAKRLALSQAAQLVRRFHTAGFVHGDLIATNLFVAADARSLRFYFMDNDRTRRYPVWIRQPFWKRNLVQLNRLPLPSITLQDRMRFFKAYLGSRTLAASDRALARWLEQRTRRRREECDGVDGSGDFRQLMRWPNEISQRIGAKKVG